MKKLIFVISLIISFSSFSNGDLDLQFKVSSSIYKNENLDFKPHHGKPPYGSYLTMNINFTPMKSLFNQLSLEIKRPLKSRGESHITVVTPIEYDKVLKSKIKIDEIDKIALKYMIQSVKFNILCLGRGVVKLGSKKEETYYIVVKSEELLSIRKEIQSVYVSRGGDSTKFIAKDYYPHITLGFTKRDLHISDGIIKGEKSCFAALNIDESSLH